MERQTRYLLVLVAWHVREKFRAEGAKLRAEGAKLWAEGDKLKAEGDKLKAEGTLIFVNAVIKEYGNVEIVWNDDGCIVDGDVFKNSRPKEI